ncbi:MAG: hypothetical protein PF480_14985 [Roseovarius sp.]|jgi:hypothetical protein|nr:hypothetical protein [Roseovarius sp.]
MSILNQISRRTVLVGQAALAGLGALPGMALARSPAAALDCAAEGGNACLPARWHSATAEELAAHVGDRFRVSSPEHGNLVLKLVAVEPHASGTARPGDLPRREGVTALFESPDMAPLVADGYGTYRVSHPRIGTADLYLSAAPRRNGGNYIEVVLN